MLNSVNTDLKQNHSKKKLLFINGHLKAGGVEKSLVDILNHLDYKKYDVDLLLLEGLGEYQSSISEDVHIILRPLQNTYGPFFKCIKQNIKQRDWFSLRMRLIFLLQKVFGSAVLSLTKKDLIGSGVYDCIVGFRSGICSDLAVRFSGSAKRIIWWHHGSGEALNSDYHQTAVRADHLISVSNYCRSMIMEKFPDLEEKVTVIPNIVDKELITKKASEDCSKQTVLRTSIPIITSVSRISPEKHLQNILYTAAKLKNNGLRFVWYVVGDGEGLEELKKESTNLGLDSYVKFAGARENPYPYLNKADLFVHPSYVESQGLAVLEAMSLHVPCVVTASEGPKEYIQNGVNGILTEKDPESLYKNVFTMLTDKELREQIKQKTELPDQFLPNGVIDILDQLLLN